MNLNRAKQGIRHPRDAVYVISKDLDIELSKLICGNSAGLTRNIKGYFKNKFIKKIKLENYNSIEEKFASEFVNQGHLTLGQPFNPDLIEKISTKFQKFIENPDYYWVRGRYDNVVYSKALWQGHKIIPEVAELVKNPLIKKIIEKYYGSHFRVTSVDFWRNDYVPYEVLKKSEILSNHWHCDAYDTSTIRIYVYLSDVTEHDGPFHTQTIERTKELMKMGFKNRNNPSIPITELENPKHITKAIGPKGTTTMCNCNIGIHRAGVPEKGRYRDIIQLIISPSSKPMPDDWYKTLVNDKKPQLKQYHKRFN